MLNGVCWKWHVIVKWHLIKTTCRMCIQRSMRYMKHNRYMYIYVIQRWLQRYTVLMYNKGNSYLHAPATTKNQYPYLHWNWISHRWCSTLYRCTCKFICHPLFSIKNEFVWLGHKQDNIVTSFTATAWSHRLLEHRLCQTGANLGDVT